MATLAAADIGDLVTGTLNELGRMKFNQIATKWNRYDVLKRIIKKDKVQFDGGKGISRTIMVDHGSAAKNVGLFEKDDVNVEDVLQTIEIPWRHTTTNYAYERREFLMNSGKNAIVNLIKTRRVNGLMSLAARMEEDFWSSPPSSTDKTAIFGVPYWLTQHATAGFNGGNHDNFSAGAGGLDADTYTRWKNWTGDYTNITKADLITKMRAAYRNIHWESPVDIPDYRNGRGDQYRIYTTDTVVEGMETLGEGQNENLGRDLASMDGAITFRRHPIVLSSYLENETTNDPIYMINFADFSPVVLRGDNLTETVQSKLHGQHNTTAVFVDLTWNLLCTNKRTHAVLTTGADTDA